MNVRRVTTALVLLMLAASGVAAQQQKSIAKSQKWGDSPQALFLTQAERQQWETLLSESEAEAFIASYWARHGKAFHDAVNARIAAADRYFPLGDLKGSQTQRGRVFIILGAPNRQQTIRRELGSYGIGDGSSRGSVADKALIVTQWTYKSDRLQKDLGRSELVVRFQTDVSRGYEVIENQCVVEPYLTKAAAYLVEHWDAASAAASVAMQMPAAQQSAATPEAKTPADDVVWNASALNGALFNGESFISPTDKPFYAVSFYLPKGFAAPDEVTVAGVVRDSGDNQVLSVRTKAKPVEYDARGDRFVDASFELPAGHYSGAFALATGDGTVLAASKNEFDVRTNAHVGMSRLFLTSRIDTYEKQKEFDPFTFVAMKYAVKGDRRFRPADRIGFFTFLSNPTTTAQSAMAMRMKVSKDGNVIDSGAWMPVELTQTSPRTYLLATQFDPNSFTPGHYSLEVRIRDTKAEKESEAFKGYVSSAEFEVVQP